MPASKRAKTSIRHNPVSGTKAKQKRSSSSSAVDDILQNLECKFIEAKNDKYAAEIKRYMRNKFEFYGLKAPVRRAICKEVLANVPPLDRVQTFELLTSAWQKEQRDFQGFAADFAKQHVKTLIGKDASSCRESCLHIKTLITTKSWWDTVDMLASNVIGPMVSCHLEDIGPLMEEWIDDDNMWLRRTAILHQLKYGNKTDSSKLFRYCLRRCEEQEFFIQKSIGWALREYGKYNKSGVRNFVLKNENKLSKLSVREALKHLGRK